MCSCDRPPSAASSGPTSWRPAVRSRPPTASASTRRPAGPPLAAAQSAPASAGTVSLQLQLTNAHASSHGSLRTSQLASRPCARRAASCAGLFLLESDAVNITACLRIEARAGHEAGVPGLRARLVRNQRGPERQQRGLVHIRRAPARGAQAKQQRERPQREAGHQSPRPRPGAASAAAGAGRAAPAAPAAAIPRRPRRRGAGQPVGAATPCSGSPGRPLPQRCGRRPAATRRALYGCRTVQGSGETLQWRSSAAPHCGPRYTAGRLCRIVFRVA